METAWSRFRGLVSPVCRFVVRLHQQGKHEFRAAAQGWGGIVAGGFELFHGFVAETGLVDGEEREGFQSHGADSDAVFSEAGSDEREQTLALRVGGRVVSGGDDHVATGLPLFHRERRCGFGEQVGAGGEDTGLALADETGEFRGAAMVKGIVGAKLTDEFANGGAAWPGEEITGGGSGVFRTPRSRTVRRLGGARSGRDCASSGTRFAYFAGWNECHHADQ